MACEKIPPGLLDAPPLGWSQSLLQILGVVIGPGLDLNKNDHVVLGADEIDLPGGASVVSDENAMVVSPQVAGGGPLPTDPECVPAITPRSQPAQAAEFLS